MDFFYDQTLIRKPPAYFIEPLKKELALQGVQMTYADDLLTFTHQQNQVSFLLTDERTHFEEHENQPSIAQDHLATAPEKIAAMVFSKLKLNKPVFARNCEVRKTDKKTAEHFTDRYHLMGSTNSAYNLGLYFEDNLIAIASFSKGRKMDRLPEDKRSFELIRFCCKSGISVSGGLTKLIKNFYLEKNAGDIMTYVDKQWSNGDSFVKAGFKKAGETGVSYFLIDRSTFQRHYLKEKPDEWDRKSFYLTQNSGNIKLIFIPKHENDASV